MRELDPGVKWFNTCFYPEQRKARAAHYHGPNGTLARLREPRITLFTPWGPCYNQRRSLMERGCAREERTLVYFASLLTQWREQFCGREWKWIVLAADLYGTQINGLPQPWVEAYFNHVEGLARVILGDALLFTRWSEHVAKAQSDRDCAQQELDRHISWSIRERARKTAERRGFGDPNAYLIERLTEAFYYERTERPIKISLAPRYKDAQVDADLPRLYLVPEELRTPWLF